MPRLTQLDDVLFPVGARPVFAAGNGDAGGKLLPVPDRKAIVDTQRRRVLGIVSRDYRLVSNREALDWAYQCCRTVFPETKDSEWEVKATDAPGTAGHCFIDLVHNSTALDFSVVPPQGRPEVFGPFIRVTNSHNGLRALAFDIGFLRKVCTNGLMLPDTIIRFKVTHMRRDIKETISFDVSHERLAKASFLTRARSELAWQRFAYGFRSDECAASRLRRLVPGVNDLSPDFQVLTFCAFHRNAGEASIAARTDSGTSNEDASISPRSSTASRNALSPALS